jgi:hypothetical protein
MGPVTRVSASIDSRFTLPATDFTNASTDTAPTGRSDRSGPPDGGSVRSIRQLARAQASLDPAGG